LFDAASLIRRFLRYQKGRSWIPILQSLGAAGYHAVAVDQRGYSPGARPTGVSEYTAANLVADTIGFAKALGASRFHLVGHDRGGSVAWSLAKNHPEVLLSLTILSTPHRDAFTYALANDPSQSAMSSYIATFDQPSPAGRRSDCDRQATQTAVHDDHQLIGSQMIPRFPRNRGASGGGPRCSCVLRIAIGYECCTTHATLTKPQESTCRTLIRETHASQQSPL
jgi:pimeloyl-ACP methyl ester carboxylesterase